VDFVVHVFSESARKFYDLERLWKTATKLQLADLEKPEPKKDVIAVKRVGAKQTAGKKTVAKRKTTTVAPTVSRKTRKSGAPGDKGGPPKRTRKGS
jgi:ribosome-associated protein